MWQHFNVHMYNIFTLCHLIPNLHGNNNIIAYKEILRKNNLNYLWFPNWSNAIKVLCLENDSIIPFRQDYDEDLMIYKY